MLRLAPPSGAPHREISQHWCGAPTHLSLKHPVPTAGQQHICKCRSFHQCAAIPKRGFSKRAVISHRPLPLFQCQPSLTGPCLRSRGSALLPAVPGVPGSESTRCFFLLPPSTDHSQVKQAKYVSATNGGD